MAYIPLSLRQQVIERAHGRCEYCQTQQVIVVAVEIDHIIPESSGGETTLDNLCLACVGCNGYKLHFQTGIDPQSGLVGLPPVGRATIDRLRINRQLMIEARRRWVAGGWHPPDDKT